MCSPDIRLFYENLKIFDKSGNDQIMSSISLNKQALCVSIKEVIITSIELGFDQKNWFLWGVVFFQVQWFGAGSRYGLDNFPQCEKKVKEKSESIEGQLPIFEKLHWKITYLEQV